MSSLYTRFLCSSPLFSPNVRDETENIQLYSAGAINQVTRLTQAGVILIAVLRGGDYDKVACISILHASSANSFNPGWY
jgi:hypothetical protein